MKTLFYYMILMMSLFINSLIVLGQNQTFLDFDSLASLVQINLWDDPQLAQSYANRYNDLAQNQADHLIRAKGSNFIGMTHHVLGDVEQAIQFYLKAHESAKLSDDKRYAAILLNNIGAAYKAREKPEETIKYYKEALVTFEAINDTFWIANVNNNLAVMYNAQGKNADSEKHFIKAKERFTQLDDKESLTTLYINFASLYFDVSKFEKSKENIDLFFATDPPENDLFVYGNHLLAKMAINEGDLTTAEKLVNETLRITKEKGFVEPRMNALKIHYTLLKKQKRYHDALIAHEEYVSAKDSLFNKQKDEQITEMLSKYETVEKESRIAQLSLEDEMNQSRISQQRWALGATVIGLGLLSFLLYRLFGKNKKIQTQNTIISKANKEKEVLLKEIHHRVKNNLQVISSLLGLQSLSISDQKTKDALQEGRARVHSMSLIHQNLYQKDNLTGISMRIYIHKLCQDLIRTYNTGDAKITLEEDVQTDLTLDVESVVPIGLIINELVTNSLKYAFPDKEEGIITVALKEVGDQLMLTVFDNGAGVSESDLASKTDSFGLSLIRAFEEKLDAKVTISGKPSMKVSLEINKYVKA